MFESFWDSMLANGVLAAAYALYKIFDRCANSKCKMNKEDGFTFDLGDPAKCPSVELDKLADLIKSRSMHYKTSNV